MPVREGIYFANVGAAAWAAWGKVKIYRSTDLGNPPEPRWDWVCHAHHEPTYVSPSGHVFYYFDTVGEVPPSTWGAAFESVRRHALECHEVKL